MGFDWLGTIGRIRLESRLEVVKRIQPLVLVFLNRFVERRAEEIAHIDVVDCSQLFECFQTRCRLFAEVSYRLYRLFSSLLVRFGPLTRRRLCQLGQSFLEYVNLFEAALGSCILLCSGCFLRRGQRVVATSAVRCATPFPEEGFPRFEVPVLKTVEDTSIKLMVVHKTGEAFTLWVGDEPFGR